MYKGLIVMAINLKGRLKYIMSAVQIYAQKITLTTVDILRRSIAIH
jgi:hypothetical protein